jgi:Thaumatin family
MARGRALAGGNRALEERRSYRSIAWEERTIFSIRTRLSSIAAHATIAILAVAVSGVCAGNNVWAECAGSNVTFENQNLFPIWIGEEVEGASNIVAPPGNNWEIPAGNQITLCLPTDWISGAFWPRTECDFTGTFGQDPDQDYVDCTSSSQCCTTGNTCPQTGNQTLNNHICYGGKCVIDCSAAGTNGSCSALSNSVCVANSYCGFAGGVCKTGDCGSGLYQCEGMWDSLTAKFGPAPPVSLFEITDKAGAPNYDVSHVSGYNVSVVVTPPAAQTGGTCQPSGCVSDLNSSCPAALQVTEPTGPTGPVACGSNTFCQSGTCVNGSTCVIGCNDPADQCTALNPASLHCGEVIPTPLPAGAFPSPLPSPLPTPDGSTYFDMYEAANKSGKVDSNNIGSSMFSGNQGTPTCWGDLDCAPGETCMLGSNSGISGFPSNVGICVGAGGAVNGEANCSTTADAEAHNGCGGYPNSGVYTCVLSSITTGGETGVACVPAFNPPTIGLGPFDSTDSLFKGLGAPLNPQWLAAAIVAGGGTTPYYEAFTAACPNQYAWVYDDHAGGFACASFPADFTVAFGALSATPGATASPTPAATATATATASPTATASATTTPTATTTATATATATSTSSITTTPTATATTTATPTATMTPTPGGTPTPDCAHNFYLTTNPAGTLAFGDVTVGKSVKLPLMVTNNEPAGGLKLSSKIQTGNANSFSVIGGNCRSVNRLQPGHTCTYQIRLKGRKKSQGAVNSTLTVTGKFSKGACPAGDVQSVSVNLAGFVDAAAPPTHDSR